MDIYNTKQLSNGDIILERIIIDMNNFVIENQ